MDEFKFSPAEDERRWRNIKRWSLFFEVIFLAVLGLIFLATRH